MPAPICVKCQMTMRCEKNEQLVNDVRSGQFPASYWAGDLFQCPVCGAAFVVVGVTVPLHMADEQRVRRRNVSESITFASTLEQLEQYADQFEKQCERESRNAITDQKAQT